jgi:hypothetical protein
MTECGGGLVGTWAGKLYGTRIPESKRSGKKPLPREHGTERGYHQHRYDREAVCDPCRQAHADHTRKKANA